MSVIRVIGIGSPFGDDQVGFRVIEILKQNNALNDSPSHLLNMLSEDRPGVRLLEFMRGSKIVLIIDAVKTGAAPGTLHRYQNQEIETLKPILSSHGINIPQVLQLGRGLNDIPETIILYGIEIDEVSFSDSLTPVIDEAAIKLAKIIHEHIVLFISEQNLKNN